METFLQFKYDISKDENKKLFVRWLRKLIHIKEIQVELAQEVEVLRTSHLGILYVVPELEKSDFLDEFYKISYLRNAIFGVPFMWMTYHQMLIQDSSNEKIFASKIINNFYNF